MSKKYIVVGDADETASAFIEIDGREIGMVDHTILKQDSGWEQVRATLDDAVKTWRYDQCMKAAIRADHL